MRKLQKRLTMTLAGMLLAVGLLTPLAVPATVSAQINPEAKNAACGGVGDAQGDATAGCDTVGASGALQSLAAAAINILSWIVGVAAVIMIIIGGFKYVTSNGDSNGINSAKSTVMYALIGLAVAALAQVLVRTVLQKIG